MSGAKPVAELSAAELFNRFDENESLANKEFLGEVVQVTGKVAGVDKSDKGEATVILLGDDAIFGVICGFGKENKDVEKLVPGSVVTVRGECTGMLSDVVLIRCVIVD